MTDSLQCIGQDRPSPHNGPGPPCIVIQNIPHTMLKQEKRKEKRKKNGKEQSSTGWMWSLSAHRVNTTQQVHHTMQLLSRASVPRKALPSGASKYRSSKHYKLQQEVANLIRCPICGIDSVQPVAGNLDHLVPVCREPP